MTDDEFRTWGLGEAGTEVTLEVGSDDDSASDVRTVVFRRDVVP